jgi:hypothetical protein
VRSPLEVGLAFSSSAFAFFFCWSAHPLFLTCKHSSYLWL